MKKRNSARRKIQIVLATLALILLLLGGYFYNHYKKKTLVFNQAPGITFEYPNNMQCIVKGGKYKETTIVGAHSKIVIEIIDRVNAQNYFEEQMDPLNKLEVVSPNPILCYKKGRITGIAGKLDVSNITKQRVEAYTLSNRETKKLIVIKFIGVLNDSDIPCKEFVEMKQCIEKTLVLTQWRSKLHQRL